MAPRPLYQTHYVACATPRGYSTDALADLGCILALDVFVNRLISQGKLVELFTGWQTYERTFFTVPPSPASSPRAPAPSSGSCWRAWTPSAGRRRGRVWGCIRGDGGGGEGSGQCHGR